MHFVPQVGKTKPSLFTGAEGREQRRPEVGIVRRVVRTVVSAIVRAITGGRVRVVEHPGRHGQRRKLELHTAMPPIPGFGREPDYDKKYLGYLYPLSDC